ncbi:MAG: Brp/Blh family beta-carotene 15,15'-dioxygenase [Thermaceae bacterium]
MPHGGADALIARRLGYPLWGFVIVYLVLALLPILSLFLFPSVALCIFLLLALFHWGRVEGKGFLGYLRAGLVLAFPFLFHLSQIRPFLDAFSGGWAPPPGVFLLVLTLALILSLRRPRPWRDWLDTFFLALFLYFAHPYAGLAGYFLLRHSLDSFRIVGVRGREWVEVYALTLGGLLLAFLLWPWLKDPLASYMGAVYALTLPHALTMVELWLRHHPVLSPPPGPSRRSPPLGR